MGYTTAGLQEMRIKSTLSKDLQMLTKEPAFQEKKIILDGYLLTTTELQEISDAKGMTWETLERDHRVLYQEGAYIQKILRTD
jgi:hypothetical protein